jgi:hypothetical protein
MYEDFKILAGAPTDYKLRIKESLIIKEFSLELRNNETSVSLIYSNMLSVDVRTLN